MAARLRQDTTLTTRQIAPRLFLRSWKSLNHKLKLYQLNTGKRAAKK
jgi:hypothetical protein